MGTSASFARKALSCLAAALLAFTLVPAGALARENDDVVDSLVGEAQEADSAQVDEAAKGSAEADDSASAGSSAEAGTLAASLIGKPASFVNADVVLDGEPVIGSFTIDGLTFAVTEGSNVELVGVSGPEVVGSTHVTSEAEAEGSASEPGASVVALPESVAYNDVEYAVTSIGAYAFYLSGVTSVELPASVVDVDDRAFRSSDIASVTVAEGNLSYSSFDGALYDADRSSLLLIPEGKQGAVLLPKETEVAEAGKFSHCSLVDAISAEDGAAFASENGLLYDASLTTLLRVPAGATEIAIREGCTAIAAGAMEGCAKLATINAPASVTSISPDVFTSVPTVSLPAAALAEDAPQLTALVAFSSADDGLPKTSSAAISVRLAAVNEGVWSKLGFDVWLSAEPEVTFQDGAIYAAASDLYMVTGKQVNYRESTLASGVGHSTIGFATIWQPCAFNNIKCLYYRFYDGALWLNQKADGTGSGFRVGYVTGSTIAGVTSVEVGTSYTSLKKIASSSTYSTLNTAGIIYISLNGSREVCTATWNANYPGGGSTQTKVNRGFTTVAPAAPSRVGYRFLGWYESAAGGTSVLMPGETTGPIERGGKTYYAHWQGDIDLGFNVDTEPRDEEYAGIPKDDQTISGEQIGTGSKVEIEDPKRPGYVFQGWVIPSEDGAEVIDQDLIYQDEDDGKWYVDASKLPDYVNDEGRVELTARWTSVISVDVPSVVTFYADVVTQSNESREGLVSSAFGQNKVASQSEVDLRIVGLESEQVQGNGSTALGASDILNKKGGGAVSGTADKLFSLYPRSKALTPDDLQDPDAVSTIKPADAVDFALDDLLLEKSFAADKFTIPAGDTLNLGYRLNLSETGTELDYDKLSTLEEGQSASIANISYCFAADVPAGPFPTGSKNDPFWVENTHPEWGPVGVYGLVDIKRAADDLSAHADSPSSSSYYGLYEMLLQDGAVFQLKVDDSYHGVQLLGICQDIRSDTSENAGLTFGFYDIYAADGRVSGEDAQMGFCTQMNPSKTNEESWGGSWMRSVLNDAFLESLPDPLRDPVSGIVPVFKQQQLYGGTGDGYLQVSSGDKVWLLSVYEAFGSVFTNYNSSEQFFSAYEPFQYQALQSYVDDGGFKMIKSFEGIPRTWWLRGSVISNTYNFSYITNQATLGADGADQPQYGVVPCFCL